jgi:hypothetical protein
MAFRPVSISIFEFLVQEEAKNLARANLSVPKSGQIFFKRNTRDGAWRYRCRAVCFPNFALIMVIKLAGDQASKWLKLDYEQKCFTSSLN